jgi:hypothetical protein
MAGTAHHYCVGVVGGVLTLLPRGRYKLEYNGQARHVIVMENLFHGRHIDTICAIAQLTTPRPAQLTTPRRATTLGSAQLGTDWQLSAPHISHAPRSTDHAPPRSTDHAPPRSTDHAPPRLADVLRPSPVRRR